MKLSKKDNNLVIEIPLWQSGKSQWGNKWTVQNLIAVKTWSKEFDGYDYTISQAIYLDYKDDIQEGSPIIHLLEKDFNKVVKLLKLDIWEHQPCLECKEPIYGCFTVGEKGDLCYDCGHKK